MWRYRANETALFLAYRARKERRAFPLALPPRSWLTLVSCHPESKGTTRFDGKYRVSGFSSEVGSTVVRGLQFVGEKEGEFQ
jgi:hypothetical protein